MKFSQRKYEEAVRKKFGLFEKWRISNGVPSLPATNHWQRSPAACLKLDDDDLN